MDSHSDKGYKAGCSTTGAFLEITPSLVGEEVNILS